MARRVPIFRRMSMPLSDLEDYYRRQRYIRFEQGAPLQWLSVRRYLHYVLLFILSIRQKLTGIQIEIMSDRRTRTQKPIIYACTHIGWDDIEVAYCALQDPSWLLLGDPRELYRNFDGLMLWINGVIYCDTSYKQDRYISKENCVKLLQQGGNLLIFPEGAWNVSKNLPVMKLFTGAAEMAIRTEAEIVPVAIEQYGKKFVVNIGANIGCSNYELNQKQDLTDLLRDAMCTLKWEIMEKYAVDSRSNISPNYWDDILAGIETQMNGSYDLEDIEITRYHDKRVTEPDAAFEHLRHLIPCRENAFLFRGIG